MKVASALSSEAMAMYPATLCGSFNTRVIKFLGDQEQRWTVRGELFSAVLEYHSLNGYDMSVLRHFFRSMGGAYVDPALTNTFDITIQGNNYAYCCFDQDSFDPVAQAGEKYSVTLKIKQVRPN